MQLSPSEADLSDISESYNMQLSPSEADLVWINGVRGQMVSLRLSRQKREFEESGCSLLASAAGPRAHIQNVTRGTVYFLYDKTTISPILKVASFALLVERRLNRKIQVRESAAQILIRPATDC